MHPNSRIKITRGCFSCPAAGSWLRIIFLLLPLLGVSSCAQRRSIVDRIQVADKNPQSQLQIRSRQTREYDNVSSEVLLKVALNVLQDEGYIVKNAVLDLGLLAATREVDVTDSDERLLRSIFMGENARWDQQATIEATVNATTLSGRSRIRITFQVKIADNTGAVVAIENIDEPGYYQTFFSKLDKGLYLYREKL